MNTKGAEQLSRPGDYPPGLAREMAALTRPVHAILEDSAAEWPERICLDFLDRTWTYAEVLALVNRFAAGLQAEGAGKGARIGLCLPNCPYYVIAYYAALKIGATVVNFNVLYTREEIEQQVLDSEITVMVTLDLKSIYSKVEACLHSTQMERVIHCPLADILMPLQKYLLKIFGFYRLAHIRQDHHHRAFSGLLVHGRAPEPASIDPLQDIALFQYTGGTTGTPKAAMLTHSNVVTNAEQVTLWLQSSGEVGGEAGEPEVFLAVIPFFHVFSMTAMLNMGLHCGATLILLPRFHLRQTLQVISKKRPGVMAAVPAIFNAINHYPKLEKYDLSSLKFGISGGAALPEEVRRRFEANSRCRLVEGYGLSETSPVITCNPPHLSGRTGSIGLPLPGTEVAIRDHDTGTWIDEPGTRGELLVRGPQVMQGYWKRPEESSEVLIESGWLRTGDIGYIDDEGYVFLTDRLKDMIIVNGYKVYPRTIEDALYRHEAVAEAIVIGVPDEEKGEVPKAFVTLEQGASVKVSELMHFLHDELNPIERPASIEIRRELPKTHIGKPSRKALAEEESNKSAGTRESS